MLSIGDVARYGRVSVRMLRHYDATGLLRPARVDPVSGYRFYAAGQLARLNRVIALKELGFTLAQVRAIVDEAVGTEELHGMLRLRRAELAEAMATAEARLTQVEARIRAIESEGRMPDQDIVIKRIPPVRVAELTATAASYDPRHISPVIQPLYRELFARLAAAGVQPSGPGIAYYENAPGEGEAAEGEGAGEGRVRIHAAVTVPGSVPLRHDAHDGHDGDDGSSVGGGGFRVLDLPAVEEAATIVHRGSMDAVLPTVQALARWLDAGGYRWTAHAREVGLACPEDREEWVTELQVPIAPI
ncbi:MerR family transcriptional regulator [Phaeacidiphilus oryzae]|uniref:MerR family transcriptional regulator n=1 Tax=Phaeacidiphilus oryzae TaxID=348818 RepID=UPI00056B8B70|nr:MerR family transcriptional regulator [Phaeacidiphilus oryzae]